MTKRRSDANTGSSTAVAPTLEDAVVNSDTPNFQQTQRIYARRQSWFEAVANNQAVRDIDVTLVLNVCRVTVDGGDDFFYDDDSTSVDDGTTVLQPTTGAGRWLIKTGGGAGGTSGAGIEAAEQQCEIKRVINVDEFDNGFCEPFTVSQPSTDIEGFLLEDYPGSGTAMSIVWNPVFLDSSNKDSLFEAGYLAVSGTSVGTIQTTGTVRIGASATQWNKTSGTVNSFIQHDVTTANAPNLASSRTCIVKINFAGTLTNVSSVSLRMTDEADNPTNYEQYNATTDINGVTLNGAASGWHEIEFDLDGTSVATGTGWEPEENLLRTFSVGIVTTTSTQTHTMVFDSLVFISDDGDNVYFGQDLLAPKNIERTIVNATDKESFSIANASTRTYGGITINLALSNSYSGGTATTVRLNTLSIRDNKADFNTDAALTSGDSDLEQDFRKHKFLKASLSNSDFDLSVNWDTDLFFVVTAVPDGTSFELRDPDDSTVELPSGTAFHIINVFNNSGRQDFAYSGDDVASTGAPSHSTGTTTINVASSADVSVGDLVLKKDEIDAFISLVGTTTEDSFGSKLTLQELIIDDTALSIAPDKIVAHYSLGENASKAVDNLKGSFPDATVSGTIPSFTHEGLLGRQASGPFTDSNFISVGISDSQPINGDSATTSGVMSLVVWFFPLDSAGQTALTARSNGGGTTGWELLRLAAENLRIELNGGIAVTSSGTYTLNAWNLGMITVNENTTTVRVGLNGIVNSASFGSVTDAGNVWHIGRNGPGGQFFNGYLMRIVPWANYELTDSDFASIYNGGRSRLMIGDPKSVGFKARYERTSLGGVRLAAKVQLNRTTNAASPFLKKVAIIKKN